MANNDSLPIGQVSRATKVIGTGLKVSANYLKHYAKKTVGLETSRQALDEQNASDIYNALTDMKGSVLKLAQMLSMDKGVLPKAYVEQFSKAQYQTPPLSGPLVSHTFEKQLGKKPLQIFETFSFKASHAASIGQVHLATKGGKQYAVKIQYPGVAASIKSDIRLVTPFAQRLFDISAKELAYYLEEVENKLIEETNYEQELAQAQKIAHACKEIPYLHFPKYYEELSTKAILTMDWANGLHLNEWLKTNPNTQSKERAAQTLWDFYQFQAHVLQEMHADPHPGNFLFQEDGSITVLDFGCTKKLVNDFYYPFFALVFPEIQNNQNHFTLVLKHLGMLKPTDEGDVKTAFMNAYLKMLQLTGKPFLNTTFDFGDESYIKSIYDFGAEMAQTELFKNEREPRGTKDFIYVNRTFYGLYSLLASIGARVDTGMKNKEQILESHVLKKIIG